MAIRIICGLGNPGAKYGSTRHNAGAWLVDLLCGRWRVALRGDSRFNGRCARSEGADVWLFRPASEMSNNGADLSRLARFYKMPPASILVAYDDLDFPVGAVRLKRGGGAGGHNGVRSCIQCLGSRDFYRLRIGIGRPKQPDQVIRHVLSRPSKEDRTEIEGALESVLSMIPDILSGNHEKAMNVLHSKPPSG